MLCEATGQPGEPVSTDGAFGIHGLLQPSLQNALGPVGLAKLRAGELVCTRVVVVPAKTIVLPPLTRWTVGDASMGIEVAMLLLRTDRITAAAHLAQTTRAKTIDAAGGCVEYITDADRIAGALLSVVDGGPNTKLGAAAGTVTAPGPNSLLAELVLTTGLELLSGIAVISGVRPLGGQPALSVNARHAEPITSGHLDPIGQRLNLATGLEVTAVKGAGIVVIADNLLTTTRSALAYVIGGTRITVITNNVVGQELTACFW